MSSTFGQPVNSIRTNLATAHVAADGQLVLTAGAGTLLGALPAGRVYRVTAVQAPGTSAEAILAIFEATGRTGDTLTGVTAVEGTTDVNLAVPTPIQVRVTAKYLSELQTAVNALEVLEATTVYTTNTYPDPAWLTSIAGSKVSGNITGNATSLTGSIAESQVTNLVGDLAALSTAVTARALDSAVVHNTGIETIAGAKTFSTTIVGNISGNAGGTSLNVTGTVAIANGGTGATSAAAAFNALSPMTTTGDISYEASAGTAARLAAPTSSTTQFLTSTGTGTNPQAPVWTTIAAADITTALSAGLAGGRTVTGGTASGNSLTLQGSANATKGPVRLLGDGASDIGRFVVGGGGADAAGFLRVLYDPTFGMEINTSGVATSGVYFTQSVRTDGVTGVSAAGGLELFYNNGTTASAQRIKLPATAGTSFSVTTSGGTVLMEAGAAGPVGIGTTAAAALGAVHIRNASGSTATLCVDQSSSAASAVMQIFRANTSTSPSRGTAAIDAVWADSTDATRKGRLVLSAFDTVLREGIRIEASGSVALIGFFGATAVAKPTVTGSRGANAALASLLTALANLGLITDSSS